MTEQIEGAPSAQHGPIPEDECCIFCCDDITADNYAEYLPYPDEAVKEGEDGKKATSSSGWLRCIYCSDCLEDQMLKKQWAMWVERVKTTDCKAEQRRLLTVGPPINLKDDKGIPCPNNGEVYKLWYSKDNTEKVAKLEGSLVGEERMKFWEELKQFASCFEDDVNDKDGKDKEDGEADGQSAKRLKTE